jgi:hypothetical protein
MLWLRRAGRGECRYVIDPVISYIQYSWNQTIAKEWGVCEACELPVQ